MPNEIFNPPTLMKPAGYSHVAKISGGTLVYIAGQVSADVSGQLEQIPITLNHILRPRSSLSILPR
jgi:enamine deaminase RidA (YjgF/YER057c/UK114 family)